LEHANTFLQDLAIIMLVAGVITVIFHRLRQPVVLGYILAGIILGPHTPPMVLIGDKHTVEMLAELGMIFLLFALGLEFNLGKLKKVGSTAIVAATSEILLMLWVGYEIGRAFDWSSMDSLFLGSMLAMSSSTIIIKAVGDLGMKREKFTQLMFGILIVEDILAIAIMALLSGIALTGSMGVGNVVGTLSKLGIFLVVALISGLLLVPRLLTYIARFNSKETLLVAVLGIFFGFSLLVTKLGYSMALGAFVIGAIMAEARELRLIERLIEPLRDMFSAVFFVAIGMLVDPRVIMEYALPIAVITVAVVVFKVISCAAGTFATGHDARTSMRTGMGLAQIGEFSFIIASLGLSLKVTSDFLYPIAVAVSAITTLLTPYLIRSSDGVVTLMGRVLPQRLKDDLNAYTEWMQSINPPDEGRAILHAMIRRILIHVVLNFCAVAAIFLASSWAWRNTAVSEAFSWLQTSWQITAFWALTLLVALPFLVAAYRKLEALGMLLAEMSVSPEKAGRLTVPVRKLFATLLPVTSLILMMLLVSALSASILPPFHLLVLVVVLAVGLASLLWNYFVRWHSRLQIALKETLESRPDDQAHH
jgi:CPA2 family monovalent cation:H+ antiporter-2